MPLKIVHISQYYHEGLGYQENLLPYYQSQLGHEAIIATSDYVLPVMREIAGFEKYPVGKSQEKGVDIIRLSTLGEFKNRFVIFKNLCDFLEAKNPDYIFHHGLTSPSILDVVKYKKKHPSVFLAVDSHSDIMNSGRNIVWRNIYYRMLWKNVLGKIQDFFDIVFSVTPSTSAFLNSILGINKNKIRLLPLGCDTLMAEKISESKVDLKKKLFGINDNDFLIATGGKITPDKRFDILVKAFLKFNDLYRNSYLVIFGKISDQNVLEIITGSRNIIKLGWQDRINTLKILKSADIAIWHHSVTTLIEDAISVSTPLVLKFSGATCSRIINSGMFLFSNIETEIIEKFLIMAKSPELRKKLESNTKNLRNVLSYYNVAQDSIDYYYSRRKAYIHDFILCKSICSIT